MAKSTSDNAVDPVEQLLDLILYAPIGLVAKGIDSFPDLAKRGRTNAANARVIGQFALGATNTKARSAIADAEQHIAAFLAIVADSASPKRASARQSSDDQTSSPAESANTSVHESSVDSVISGYDSLTAAQILPLLTELDHDQLEQVELYERSHRARKTVLNRLRQLQR